jgi:hypothetical protein
MGVFAPLTGIIGAMQAAEALKLIAGAGEVALGRLWLLDGLSMEWRSVKFGQDPGCQVCRGAAADAHANSSGEAGQQAQIGTERAQIANDQRASLAGQRLERRQVEHPARGIAEQTRRQVEQQLVDQTRRAAVRR